MRLIKNFMMTGALASLATMAAVGTAAAAPVGACPTTTLDNYLVSGFTCTSGDKRSRISPMACMLRLQAQ
jgi:hypothetical protein